MYQNLFEYENGYWHCNRRLESGVEYNLRILKDSDSLDLSILNFVYYLINNIEEKVIESTNEAYSSVYLEDIESEGGITFSVLHVHSIDKFDLWFELGKSTRFLGVLYKNGKIQDFYCDSP